MPSLAHEAPLVLFRQHPSLVPALLREVFGFELPSHATVDVADADFTQPLPTQFHADLVVHLRAAPPDNDPVMGIVVEVQRARDDAKRRSWPLYVAALHARLRCPTCLLVVATDQVVATWAATPITSLQPGSPFTPLVIGPDLVPRVDGERARSEPWLGVLSALVHGNSAGGAVVTLAAIRGLAELPGDHATIFFDLIVGSLNDTARRALEAVMTQFEKYEYRSDFARKYYGAGQLDAARRVLLAMVAHRLPDVSDDIKARITSCADGERMERLVVAISGAPDPATVSWLLSEL